MAVFRIERNRDYTVMSNHHLRDTELSLKSKGLLPMMLSLPEEWNYTTRGLAAICKEGADCIGSALRELEQAGYIVRSRIRDSKGKIVDVEYIIYETPHKPQPQSAPPEPERPDTENPDMDTPCPEMTAQLKQRAAPHNSARSLRQDFCSNSKFRKWRNTVCISHFRNCGSGAKRRLRLADAIARCCHKIKKRKIDQRKI